MKFPTQRHLTPASKVILRRNELCPGPVPGDLFDIEVENGEEFLFFACVSLDDSLVQYFRSEEVASVELVPLASNGPESGVLPRNPRYLLLGVTLKDGRVLCAMPAALQRYQKRLAGGALLAIMVGLAGMALGLPESAVALGSLAQVYDHLTFLPWVFGAILVAGSHSLRTALRLPGEAA